jgi:ketosteroid isomerase-like protein
MSQENIEVVRRTFDAVAREGGEGLLTFLDPEIEWQVRADLPDTDM